MDIQCTLANTFPNEHPEALFWLRQRKNLL